MRRTSQSKRPGEARPTPAPLIEEVADPTCAEQGRWHRPLLGARRVTDLPFTVANGAGEGETAKGVPDSMTQRAVFHVFGTCHGRERLLESVHRYCADGALKGQDVRFDPTTSKQRQWLEDDRLVTNAVAFSQTFKLS